jgi:hypothetical protein
VILLPINYSLYLIRLIVNTKEIYPVKICCLGEIKAYFEAPNYLQDTAVVQTQKKL